MTQAWEALPDRQPGSVLSHIDYQTMFDDGEVIGFSTMFRHHDQRIWQVRARLNGRGAVVVDEQSYRYVLEMTSAGCRTYHFLAGSLKNARLVTSRFVNLRQELYMRLVADARGTADHPKPGAIGAFGINLVEQLTSGYNRTETHRAYIRGIGRVEGPILVIFPTSAELIDILGVVAGSRSHALVPTGVNEIRSSSSPRSFTSVNSFDETDVPELTAEAVESAISRLFNDTSATVLASLQNGDYVARPGHREARVINLNDEETKEL